MHVEAKELTDKRTILLADGEPVLVKLDMREASSAPEGTRLKARLDYEFSHVNEDGEDCQHTMVMPFAEPTMPSGPFPIVSGFTPEFRLEMN